MIYGTLCPAIGHQMLVTQPLPREAEDFPKGKQVFQPCASAHVANLLLTKRYYIVDSIDVLAAATEYCINLSLVLNPLC